MEEYLNFAKSLAREAGEIMRKYFDQNAASEYKADKTIVTIADKEINDLVIRRVQERFPTHSVNGEEKSFADSNEMWICDPVDGTAMFARGVAVATFSLAFAVDGEPQVGVIYDPFTDKMWWAIKNSGAFCNNNRILVNDFGLDDMRAVVNYDYLPVFNDGKSYVASSVEILSRQVYCTSIGSQVHSGALVADGSYVATIFPGTVGKNVDVAASKVIIEEAGGKTSDIDGNPQKYDGAINGFIGANPVVFDEIVKVLKSAKEAK